MTRLLKHDSGARQTPIARFTGRLPLAMHLHADEQVPSSNTGGAVLQNPAGVGIERPAAERAALETEIEALRERIGDAAKTAEREIAESYSGGREAGLAEAREGDDRRIALLEQALERARADFHAKDADVEVLAIAIARKVIAQILGDRDAGAERVEAAVARQIEQIDPAEVRRIRVSASDFTDAPPSRIVEKFPDLPVHRDSDLEAGECIIELDLGCIEVSPLQQLAGADAHLAALADERKPRS